MIDLGKTACTCANGYVWPPPPGVPWQMCTACDGVGQVWQAGGPRFGALLELGDRNAGEIVELATGERARILWHMPRKAPRRSPQTTFVALIDDFDGTESRDAIPVSSRLGVVSVAARAAETSDDLHDGEKDADAVDPIANARRVAFEEGPLL